MSQEASATKNDLPLVTFAVFAYNQEQYIHEAIEGAFSQTYQPLEIILSDDCSTDRTYEIMRGMAEAYKGPHEVKVRRNEFNLGTALHVQTVFQVSKGALFVVAAGDDISLPERTKILVDAWLAAGRPDGLLHSGRCIFQDSGDAGRSLELRVNRLASGDDVICQYAKGKWLPAAAPTCAYTRSVFEKFPPLQGGSIIEDAPLMFRSALIGTFIAVDRSLVRQRRHEQANGSGWLIMEEVKWNRFVQSKIVAFNTMLRDLLMYREEVPGEQRIVIERRILRVINGGFGLAMHSATLSGYSGKLKLAIRIARSPMVASNFVERIRFLFLAFQLNRFPVVRKLFQMASNLRRRVGDV